MAQIPMGQFGQATVVPRANRSSVDLSGSDAAGRAITQVGQMGMQMADQALRQQKAERDRAEDEAAALARAKAQNAVLDDEIASKAIADEIRTRIADRSLPYDKAQEELQTRLSMREREQVAGLDPVGQENYNRALQRNRFSLNSEIDAVVTTARRSDFREQRIATRDRLGKLASDPNADIDKIVRAGAELQVLAEAGGDAAVFGKEQQEWADRAYRDNASSRIIANRDSLEGLTAVEKDLSEKDGRYFGKLDASAANALVSQIQVRKDQLENAQRADADKRESVAQRAINAMESQLATGVPAPVEQRLAWLEQVKGTTFEQQAGQYVEMEKQSQALLRMGPAQQREFLQRMQAEQQTKGATVDQQRLYNGLKSASDARIKMLRDQPLQHYATTTGATIQPLDVQALVSGDVGKVQAQIAERMNILATQRKQYGAEAGSQPLLPQEATMLAAALRDAPPTKSLELFGAMSVAFADERAYTAALQQISPGAPVRAVAGTLYAKQRSTTLQSAGMFSGAVKASSGDIARTMLIGEKLLAPSKPGESKGAPFPMPAPKQFATAFETQVGTAFRNNPGAYEMSLQAARAYYAGKANEAGDVTGGLDEKLVGEAVRAVIGEPVEINGADVFPPWGMSADTFQDKLEQVWTETVIGDRVAGVILPKAKAVLPEGVSADLDDYTLQQAGDGRYYVIAGNGSFLYTAQGQPMILTVK